MKQQANAELQKSITHAQNNDCSCIATYCMRMRKFAMNRIANWLKHYCKVGYPSLWYTYNVPTNIPSYTKTNGIGMKSKRTIKRMGKEIDR